MYPENPEGTQVIVGSMNMGYLYIYIRHCQESNSQPVPSQAGADQARSQEFPAGWATVGPEIQTLPSPPLPLPLPLSLPKPARGSGGAM